MKTKETNNYIRYFWIIQRVIKRTKGTKMQSNLTIINVLQRLEFKRKNQVLKI